MAAPPLLSQPVVLVVANFVLFIQVLFCAAVPSYSCCNEGRQGTVCTLAGSGAATSIDSEEARTAAIFGPASVALHSASSILVAAYSENRLRLIYHNGSVTTLAGGGAIGENEGSYVDSDDPQAARFARPNGVCSHEEGSVLLCDAFNHRIRLILRNGSVRTLAGSGGSGTDNGGYVDSADPLQARFFHPAGIISITEGSERLIIVGGNYDQHIRVIYANGTVSTLAGSGGSGLASCDFQDSADPLDARFCEPTSVAADPLGNIIVADFYGNRVRKVWRDGSVSGVTTVAGHGPRGTSGGESADSDNPQDASFFTPNGIAIDGVGDIVVGATYEHRVRIIYTNGSVRTLAGSGPSTGLSTGTIGSFADGVPLLQAAFNLPHHVVVDSQGNVIVCDFSNHRVRMLCTGLPVAAAQSITPSGALSSRTAVSHPSASLPASRTIPSRPVRTLSATLVLRYEVPVPGVTTVLSEVLGESAARAIAASGTAASGVSGFLSQPATASVSVRSGMIAMAADCEFVDGAEEPDSLQYPATFDAGGSDNIGKHSGGVVCICILAVVVQLLRGVLGRFAVEPSASGGHSGPSVIARCMVLLCGLEAIAVQYYVPSAAFGTVMVARHSSSVSAIVVCAVGAVVIACIVACRAHTVLVCVPNEVEFTRAPDELSGTVKCRWRGNLVVTHGAYFAGCRDGSSAAIRLSYFVELLCSVAMGCAAGWRPRVLEGSCVGVASTLLVCTALLLIYLVVFRPYEHRLEAFFSHTFACLQVVQAAPCSVAVTLSTSRTAHLALSWTTLFLSWGLLSQLCVTAAWSCFVTSRHHHLRTVSSVAATSSLPSPILQVPAAPVDNTRGARRHHVHSRLGESLPSPVLQAPVAPACGEMELLEQRGDEPAPTNPLLQN